MVPEGLIHQLEPIIRHAGSILLSYYHQQFTRTQKANGDFVTEADLASEKYLIMALTPLLPGAAIVAEESGTHGKSDYCWVIDPLDGTTNFAHGLPYFCISVALTYQGKSVIGVVYQPLLNEYFMASRGKGAFLNGKPIKVSAIHEIKDSMVLVGLPYAKSATYSKLFEYFALVAKKSYSVRHFGAAALDQAYVACGRVDGVFFEDLAWWDIAAGYLLIEEAGGLVTDFEGKPIGADYKSFLGAGVSLHGFLKTLLKT